VDPAEIDWQDEYEPDGDELASLVADAQPALDRDLDMYVSALATKMGVRRLPGKLHAKVYGWLQGARPEWDVEFDEHGNAQPFLVFGQPAAVERARRALISYALHERQLSVDATVPRPVCRLQRHTRTRVQRPSRPAARRERSPGRKPGGDEPHLPRLADAAVAPRGRRA
jgi:hypothetical protein